MSTFIHKKAKEKSISMDVAQIWTAYFVCYDEVIFVMFRAIWNAYVL